MSMMPLGTVTFRSEVDALFIVMSVVFTALVGPPLVNLVLQGAWLSTLPIVLALGLWGWLAFGTYYTVTDSHLLVRSGPVRRSLAIQDIELVRPTNTLLSAPALSNNRIEVIGKTARVVISPANRSRFLAELLMRNPAVKVEQLVVSQAEH